MEMDGSESAATTQPTCRDESAAGITVSKPTMRYIVAVGDAQILVRVLEVPDGPAAVAVINRAAEWYAEFLDPSEIDGPEMTIESWAEERRRMTWYGAFAASDLVGVMGLEYSDDAALFRHAYVLPDRQRRGVAATLSRHLEHEVEGVGRILVGTYAANYKARAALEQAGYRESPDPEALLRRYYDIPEDRLRSSVVYEKNLDLDEPAAR